MTGELNIDYETLAQDAMRGIVRAVLQRVAALGHLPGEHHFYIAFDTRAPGVVVSRRLKQRYPEEMTIVLQHQFRNLTVDDERFEVTLSFDNVPERLYVPLRAIRVFFDPSVPYGLQLDSSDLIGTAAGEPDAPAAEQEKTVGAARRPALDGLAEPAGEPRVPDRVPDRARGRRKPRVSQGDAAGEIADPARAEGVAEPVGSALPRSQAGRSALVQSQPDEPANDAKVVQLDRFRKR